MTCGMNDMSSRRSKTNAVTRVALNKPRWRSTYERDMHRAKCEHLAKGVGDYLPEPICRVAFRVKPAKNECTMSIVSLIQISYMDYSKIEQDKYMILMQQLCGIRLDGATVCNCP